MFGLGSIGCFEEQPFFTSAALRGDLAQEEYLDDPSAGTVRRVDWSHCSYDLDSEGRVVAIERRPWAK